VILFTKKDKPAPPFLAISAEFRDRLRFIVVPESIDGAKDLMNQYGVSDLPTLVVEETYDAKKGEVRAEKKLSYYTEKEYKIPHLKKFIEKFARKDTKMEVEELVEEKEQQKS
jgi:hypothetical protein